MLRALLLLAVGVTLAAAAVNACRDSAGCCQVFDFESDMWGGADFAQFSGTTIYASQGISITSSGILGIFNSSNNNLTKLHSATEGYVLGVFSDYPDTLAIGASEQVWHFGNQPACVASIATLRTVDFDHRETLNITLARHAVPGNTSTPLVIAQSTQVGWTLGMKDQSSYYEFTLNGIEALIVDAKGRGNAAVARVEVCFSAPRDACGVCGGKGDGCNGEGSPCDTGLAGHCAAGTLDADLMCVPNLAGAVELCNGIDDNCNGQIDEGDWGTITCGVGACQRSFSKCIAGVPNTRCVPLDPTPEICNGIDDDCNGLVDDGAVCSATPSPTPSSQPSESSTPSPSATPSPSPASMSATPSATPLPRGDLTYIVPLLSCVRQLNNIGLYQAVFGWAYSGQTSDVTVPVALGSNWLSSNILTRASLEQSQPTSFRVNTAIDNAFEVTFSDGEEIHWTLEAHLPDFNVTTRQVAIANRASPPCPGSGGRLATLEPITPFSSQCVEQVNGAQCVARFGYYNPNPQTVQLDIGEVSNEFIAAHATTQQPDRRQPRIFTPGWVHESVSVSFDCSMNLWSLEWAVTVLGTTKRALVDQSNVC
jgi:hypothetical protein